MDDTKKLIEKYKRELMELSAAAAQKQERKPEPKRPEQPRQTEQIKSPKIIGYVEEDNTAYDNFLAELGKVPDSDITTTPAAGSGSKQPAPAMRLTGEAVELIEEAEPLAPSPDCTNEPEFINEPNGEITEIIDEIGSGSRTNSAAPSYVEVPSTAQVRAKITENSRPADNVPEENVSGITDNSATTPRADVADTIRTTREQAERLNDQPVSGTNPGEQLTGRSFEGIAPPPASDVSMEQGSRAEPIEYPKMNFNSYEDFEKANTGRGSLMFKVYTGREAVVIEGAECVITKTTDGGVHTVARLVTDESGQTSSQELPAPPKELSQHSENTIQPFALYDAEVIKPGFVHVVLKDVPVFDGVQSVQRVFMIVDG